MPGLRDILNAATPGPWTHHRNPGAKLWRWVCGRESVVAAIVVDTPVEIQNARLIALAPQLAALALDMGELLRGRLYHGFVPGSNGDTDAYALLARLDQIGAADETRLGREQT